MADQPDLSIVTICFENPEDLASTLMSCTGLDMTRSEIIVQDGSRDLACEKVADDAPVVITYMRERDAGKYDAMNRATARAQGRAVLYLNSGDRLVDAASLSRIVADNRADLSSTILHGDVIDIFGRVEIPRPSMVAIGPEQIRTGTLPSHQAILIPTTFARANPYDTALHISADTRFLCTAFATLPSRHLATPLAYFTYGGISNSAGSMAEVLRAYRETSVVRHYRRSEKIRILMRLMIRKAAITTLGRDRYLRIQARNARARAAAAAAAAAAGITP